MWIRSFTSPPDATSNTRLRKSSAYPGNETFAQGMVPGKEFQRPVPRRPVSERRRYEPGREVVGHGGGASLRAGCGDGGDQGFNRSRAGRLSGQGPPDYVVTRGTRYVGGDYHLPDPDRGTRGRDRRGVEQRDRPRAGQADERAGPQAGIDRVSLTGVSYDMDAR